MDNGSYTSCAGVKVTGEEAEEARMNTMVMDWNWRHQYQLLIHLLWVQAVTHRNIHRCEYIHGLVEYMFPRSVSRQGLEARTYQQQETEPAPRSWSLTHSPIKGTGAPWRNGRFQD